MNERPGHPSHAGSTPPRSGQGDDARCPACGATDVQGTTLLTDDRYRLFRCSTCGTQFYVDTGGNNADSASHYKWESYKLDVYSDDLVRESFEKRYGQLLDKARPMSGTLTSVLDVGCGIGNFVAFAERLGMRAIGTDVSLRAVEEARQRGLNVVASDEVADKVPSASVDALTLWDVIEHVHDPGDFLEGILPMLRPGGVLLFETPDAEFPVRTVLLNLHRLTRGRVDLTGPMYYWEHKIYFSERGLRALLEPLGVDVTHVERRTSVRAKMQREFSARQSAKGRLLRLTWPVLETIFRRAGRGNKLLVIARKRDESPRTPSAD
jgi:2-polyprenyl-3-methyl-5-hydroxy-6-metoxy-1,4-benzoquinol methylase